MPCPVCNSTLTAPSGEIIHKPGCANKPKLTATCSECGGPQGISGYRHAPGCSKIPTVLVEDYLLRPIGGVCKDDLRGVLPMRCYTPARPPVPSGETLLKQPAAPDHAPVAAVGDVMVERLLTALSSMKNANQISVRRLTDAMTIRAFRGSNEAAQMTFINQLWDRICTTHAFNTLGNQMSDPAADDLGGPTLPSSVCPTVPGASTFRKRLRGRRPFHEFGIGFRVDGSDQSAISRILSAGMTQQRLNSAFMLGRRGMRLDGTNMMDAIRARCWTANDDIFNETAVCVSRNFFGGTAFPERETQGTYYLWAVNVGNLTGFDTEQYQLGLPNSRQWRPGEKAFPFIPPANVLGYVQIDRRGAPDTGGWRVDISKAARWTFTGGTMSVRQRTYIEDELAAWRGGSYTIPASYDFAT